MNFDIFPTLYIEAGERNMSSVRQVVIVIPIYNEQAVIASTITEIFDVMKEASNDSVHILVFDSHSTDDSVAVVQALQQKYENLHLASEPRKTGLGSAYHQAFQIALNDLKADIVFEFDADGSHQPKYIPKMLAVMMRGADVVVGSRYVRGGSIPKDWGFHRQLIS